MGTTTSMTTATISTSPDGLSIGAVPLVVAGSSEDDQYGSSRNTAKYVLLYSGGCGAAKVRLSDQTYAGRSGGAAVSAWPMAGWRTTSFVAVSPTESGLVLYPCILLYPLQMLDRYVDAIPTGVFELQVLLADSVCIEKSNPSVPTPPVPDVHDQVALLEGKRMPDSRRRQIGGLRILRIDIGQAF
jgi:hypothetical protein